MPTKSKFGRLSGRSNAVNILGTSMELNPIQSIRIFQPCCSVMAIYETG
jgi:hypothetical protein